MHDAIISYSRKDSDFVAELAAGLQKLGKDVWTDYRGIFVGEEWWERICIAIESADNFVFVISPDSLASAHCKRELELAIEHHKHVLPILYRSPQSEKAIPGGVAKLERVDYLKTRDIDATIASIRAFIEENPALKRYHSRLLSRAREWKKYSRDSALLAGEDLEEAQRWLRELGKSAKFRATPLEREFVRVSEERIGRMSELRADLVASQVLRNADIDPELGVALSLAAIDEYTMTAKSVMALTTNLPQVKTIRRFTGHRTDAFDKSVHSVDVSCQNLVASAAGDGTVRIWDPETLAEAFVYDKHERNMNDEPWAVLTARWSPDDALIASGGKDGVVRIWQAGSGEDVSILARHEHWVNTVCWSPDGSMVASCGRDGRIIIWNAQRGTSIKTFRLDILSAPRNLCWSPAGNRLVAVSDNGRIRLIDTTARRIVNSRRLSQEDSILSADWSPDGLSIVTFSNFPQAWRADVQILDAADLSLQWNYCLDNDCVRSVKWSNDGQFVAVGSARARIYILEPGVDEPKRVLVGHRQEILDLAWADDDRTLVSCGQDSVVRVWTLEDEQQQQIVYRHGKQVSDIDVTPDAQLIVSGGYDGDLIAYSPSAGAVVGQGKAYPRGHVHQLALSPGKDRLLCGADCKIARMWNTGTWKKTFDITGFTAWAEGIAWSPDGRHYAVGAGNISIYSSENPCADRIAVLKGHGDALSAIAWSPDGKFLASIGLDLSLIIWDMQTMDIVWQIQCHDDKPFGLDWSPDSSLVVTGGKDGEARVWNVRSGELVTRFTEHRAMVDRTNWSPDGALIASTAGKELRLWEPLSGQSLFRLTSRNGYFSALAWESSGKRLWTGHEDGAVSCWSLILDPQSLLEIARSRDLRPLTSAERIEYGLPQELSPG